MLNLMVAIFVFFCRRMLVRTRSRRGSCRPGVSKQVRYEGFWKVWAKWHLCRKTECQCYILNLRNIKTSIASKPIVVLIFLYSLRKKIFSFHHCAFGNYRATIKISWESPKIKMQFTNIKRFFVTCHYITEFLAEWYIFGKVALLFFPFRG